MLAHFHKTGDLREEAVAAFNLGNTHSRQEEFAAAREMYERALELSLAHQMHPLTVHCLMNLGAMWQQAGENENTLAHYEGALRWSRAIEDIFLQAHALDLIGLTHQHEQRFAKAREAWSKALELYRGLKPEFAQMAEAGAAQMQERLAGLPGAARAVSQAEPGVEAVLL